MIFRSSNAIAFLLLLPAIASAQVTGVGTPLISSSSMHILIDGRSAALGESWAGRARTPSAWNSNPASLAGAVGAGIEYASRLSDHATDYTSYVNGAWLDYRYYSAGAWGTTPVGTFALHYNKFNFGTFQMTFDSGAQGENFTWYDDVIALSYATDILAPISFGATIKKYRNVITGIPEQGQPGSSLYFDFGTIASAESPLNIGMTTDSIHGGISVQNLGENYVYFDPAYAERVAQWLRAGFAYDAGFAVMDSLPLLRASVTAEYRRLLNSSSLEENNSDFFGAGIELMAYDIVSLRLGVAAQPGERAPGTSSKPSIRYGGGINLPLRKTGIDLPLHLAFDYANIPLHRNTFANEPTTEMRHAFDVRMEYTASIFR